MGGAAKRVRCRRARHAYEQDDEQDLDAVDGRTFQDRQSQRHERDAEGVGFPHRVQPGEKVGETKNAECAGKDKEEAQEHDRIRHRCHVWSVSFPSKYLASASAPMKLMRV